jgi:hypothetical protein
VKSNNKGQTKAYNLTHSWGWPRLHDDAIGRKGVDASYAALWQEVDQRFVNDLRDPTDATERLSTAAAMVNHEADRHSDDEAAMLKALLWPKNLLDVSADAQRAWDPGTLSSMLRALRSPFQIVCR